jgi:hypothetical protein
VAKNPSKSNLQISPGIYQYFPNLSFFVNLLKFKDMAFEIIDVQENGQGQFLQLPASLKIEDDKVFLRKVGNILMVIPKHNP